MLLRNAIGNVTLHLESVAVDQKKVLLEISHNKGIKTYTGKKRIKFGSTQAKRKQKMTAKNEVLSQLVAHITTLKVRRNAYAYTRIHSLV